jgi:catechol 2,3-dioxygenase-like lactoylglutathione lyase family enzyme
MNDLRASKYDQAMVIVGHNSVLQRVSPPPSGWPAQDTRRLLRATLKVRDLQASVRWYARHFGLLLRAPLDVPGAAVQRAVVEAGRGGELGGGFALELVEHVGAAPPVPGDWLAHLTLAVDSTAEVVASVRADAGAGGRVADAHAAVIPVRAASPVGGQSRQGRVAAILDPDGYPWRVMELHGEQAAPRERLCALGLRVADLEASLAWWCGGAGARVVRRYDARAPPAYRSAMVGYGEEAEAALVELRQAEQPALVNRGDGLVRLVVGTADLEATAADMAARGAAGEWCELGDAEDARAAVQALRMKDPDGWAVCFVAAAP